MPNCGRANTPTLELNIMGESQLGGFYLLNYMLSWKLLSWKYMECQTFHKSYASLGALHQNLGVLNLKSGGAKNLNLGALDI